MAEHFTICVSISKDPFKSVKQFYQYKWCSAITYLERLGREKKRVWSQADDARCINHEQNALSSFVDILIARKSRCHVLW